MDAQTMIELSALPLPVILIISFLSGMAYGYLHFRALKQTTDLIVSKGNLLLSLVLTFGRLAFVAAVFYAAVLIGGYPLLAALAGFVCARHMLIWQIRKSNT